MKRGVMVTMIGKQKLIDFLCDGNTKEELAEQLLEHLKRREIEDMLKAIHEAEAAEVGE